MALRSSNFLAKRAAVYARLISRYVALRTYEVLLHLLGQEYPDVDPYSDSKVGKA